jgi:hypothetical protein
VAGRSCSSIGLVLSRWSRWWAPRRADARERRSDDHVLDLTPRTRTGMMAATPADH